MNNREKLKKISQLALEVSQSCDPRGGVASKMSSVELEVRGAMALLNRRGAKLPGDLYRALDQHLSEAAGELRETAGILGVESGNPDLDDHALNEIYERVNSASHAVKDAVTELRYSYPDDDEGARDV